MLSKVFVAIALLLSFASTQAFAAKIKDGYAIVRTSKEKVINKKYKTNNSKAKSRVVKKNYNKPI
jgi:hypothetical protein